MMRLLRRMFRVFRGKASDGAPIAHPKLASIAKTLAAARREAPPQS